MYVTGEYEGIGKENENTFRQTTFWNTVKCGKRKSEGRFNVNEVNSSFFSV